MNFIVPAVQVNVLPLPHFGAVKLPMPITAPPGHPPSSGIVYLRGGVGRSPAGMPPLTPSGNMLHIFTLPASMRPAEDCWVTAQIASYTMQYDGEPLLCIVRGSGEVHIRTTHIGYDGTVFFDGISFFAAALRKPPRGKRTARKARRS